MHFGELNPGDQFVYKNVTYVKVSPSRADATVDGLSLGWSKDFAFSDEVEVSHGPAHWFSTM